jgi:hypothetical protein
LLIGVAWPWRADNIHVIRGSLQKLMELCQSDPGSLDELAYAFLLRRVDRSSLLAS